MNTIVFTFHNQSYTWIELAVGAAMLTACVLFVVALRYILATERSARCEPNNAWTHSPEKLQPLPIYVPLEDPTVHP